MIFSRGRGKADRDSTQASGDSRRGQRGRGDKQGAETASTDMRPNDSVAEAGRIHDASTVGFGPYDSATAPDDDQARLDLGALRIPAIPDVAVQLQTGGDGQVQQILLGYGGSRLQLAAFAAPRTEGTWDEIRASLITALTEGGSRPIEVPGDYGVELRARLTGPEGPIEVRHVGVDGPRWFVHCVFAGAAAADPAEDAPLRDVLRGLVVDRGDQAMPVSEALPLRLPPEAAQQLAEAGAQAQEP